MSEPKSDDRRGLIGRLFGKEKQPQKTDVVEEHQPIEAEAQSLSEDQSASPDKDDVQDRFEKSGPVELEAVTDEANGDESNAPADVVAAAGPAPSTKKKSWFARLTSGLTKTSSRLGEGITKIFTHEKLDDATLDDFEDILIQADLGVETAMRIREQLQSGRYDKGVTAGDVQTILAEEVERVLAPTAHALQIATDHTPHIILVVGVNGSGKTTTIGKLAAQYRSQGLSVMIAAGDTFRAAAIDQLKVWGERADVKVVSREVGSDAAGLAFDAVKEAQAVASDVLLIDTAGRLQNKQALMEELEKVIRVIRKLSPDAPHDTLLVLDATTGQNAISQVDAFKATAGVTGLIMTKLDGTARGGILVAIAEKYGLPIHAIGIGEGIDDLQPFDAKDFAAAIAGR